MVTPHSSVYFIFLEGTDLDLAIHVILCDPAHDPNGDILQSMPKDATTSAAAAVRGLLRRRLFFLPIVMALCTMGGCPLKLKQAQ